MRRMSARWDGDTRGAGVADAAQLVAGAGELLAAFGDTAWVAEQPELHLRPHIDAWCEHDQRLSLSDAYTDEHHSYVLELKWCGEPATVGQVRAAVFSLIGAFAESATY